jgi:hypothetical protein
MNLETDRYKVEYRKKVGITETENNWFTKETIEDYTLLNDLQPDTEYEVRVTGIYRTFTSHPTETKTFRTPQPRVFACGQEAPVSIPPDTKPLITAMVGQRWKIGQFEMEVVSVQGGSGVFTGIGAVIIPYLGFRVYSKFEKLKVNENQEVVQGDVIALSEDWEVFKQNWQPKDPTPDIDDVEEIPTEDSATPEFVGVEVPYEGEIDSVYLNPDGDIVIINEEGEETVIDQPVNAETGEPENTRITDSSGQQWVVDKDGNVSGSGTNGSTSETNNGAIPQNEFERLVKQVLTELKVEVSDGLTTSVASRNEKLQILERSIIDAGFSGERYLITGAQDQLIAEGFSKLFGEKPVKSQDSREEDQAIFLIEDSYVDLYEADVMLVQIRATSQQIETWDQSGFSFLVGELRQAVTNKSETERIVLEGDQEKMKLFLTEIIKSKLGI